MTVNKVEDNLQIFKSKLNYDKVIYEIKEKLSHITFLENKLEIFKKNWWKNSWENNIKSYQPKKVGLVFCDTLNKNLDKNIDKYNHEFKFTKALTDINAINNESNIETNIIVPFDSVTSKYKNLTEHSNNKQKIPYNIKKNYTKQDSEKFLITEKIIKPNSNEINDMNKETLKRQDRECIDTFEKVYYNYKDQKNIYPPDNFYLLVTHKNNFKTLLTDILSDSTIEFFKIFSKEKSINLKHLLKHRSNKHMCFGTKKGYLNVITSINSINLGMLSNQNLDNYPAFIDYKLMKCNKLICYFMKLLNIKKMYNRMNIYSSIKTEEFVYEINDNNELVITEFKRTKTESEIHSEAMTRGFIRFATKIENTLQP